MTTYQCPRGHVSVEWTLAGVPMARCGICGSPLVVRPKLRLVSHAFMQEDVTEKFACPRCGSDEWAYIDYGGCSVCRKPRICEKT